MTDRTARRADSDTAPLAPIAVVLGLLVLVAAGTQLTNLPRWAEDYGVLVYPAFVLCLMIAGRLLWWGAGILARLDRPHR
jgi:protein-S-isoprenylcysteine O-methyltransferase Ste14